MQATISRLNPPHIWYADATSTRLPVSEVVEPLADQVHLVSDLHSPILHPAEKDIERVNYAAETEAHRVCVSVCHNMFLRAISEDGHCC